MQFLQQSTETFFFDNKPVEQGETFMRNAIINSEELRNLFFSVGYESFSHMNLGRRVKTIKTKKHSEYVTITNCIRKSFKPLINELSMIGMLIYTFAYSSVHCF